MGFNISELEWHNVLDKIEAIETENKKLQALIKEQKETLPIHHVSNLLIAWEQYKKANWWDSEAVDVEKVLMDRFIAINCC